MRWFSGAISFTFLAAHTSAIGQQSNINFNGNGLELASSGSAVQILCEQDDRPAVLRVCDDLALDFGRVTGVNGSVTLLSNGSAPTLNASMIYNITGRTTFNMPSSSSMGGTVIAGTIGNSPIIDRLMKNGKIGVSAISGTWEAYVTTVVDNPMVNVSQALVIAGQSDRISYEIGS